MTLLDRVVESTDCPVLVTDEQWRVVRMNPAAERLLGFREADARNRACHELFCGRDRFGNRFCHRSCSVGAMARRQEPVRYFEMEIPTAGGTRSWVGLCILVLPGERPDQFHIVHLITPVADATEQPQDAPERPQRPGNGDLPALLTGREIEVLRLLAQGKGSGEIAGALCISLATVRNHVQSILRKLGVHRQVEAVAIAHQAGLA